MNSSNFSLFSFFQFLKCVAWSFLQVFKSVHSIQYFSHLAEYKEITENDYNLSVSTYVEQEDTREVIDISVLNAKISEIVAKEQVLREEIDKIIAEIEGENNE